MSRNPKELLASAQQLARLLLDVERTKRQKIIWCLDTDFRAAVIKEIVTLESEEDIGQTHATPPGRIPNCS